MELLAFKIKFETATGVLYASERSFTCMYNLFRNLHWKKKDTLHFRQLQLLLNVSTLKLLRTLLIFLTAKKGKVIITDLRMLLLSNKHKLY